MDLTHFRQHGYQVLQNVIDTEVAAEVGSFLVESSDTAIDLLSSELNGGPNAPRLKGSKLCAAIDHAYNHPDFEAIPHDLRLTMSGHFPIETRLAKRLWLIPSLVRVQAVLHEVLSDEALFMHMPPTARFVLPGNQHAAVPAHQDVSYNKHMSDFVTLWVPFVPITERCGGVAVFEGSGQPVEQLDDRSQKFWLKGLATDGFNKKHCTMNVGDALLLNRWIIHESMPNQSDHTRYSIDYRFFSSHESSSKHLLDLQRWEVIEPTDPSRAVA